MTFPAYPDYKDSGVEWLGDVPTHWEAWKISHAFGKIGSGTTPTSSESKWYEDGEIPWITTGELRESVITDTSKKITLEALQNFSALQIHPKGSLAIAMYGATIGRLGILGVDATTNQACCVLSLPHKISIKFFYYWFQAFKQIIIDRFSYGGGQPNINQEIIASLRVAAPELDEQGQIVQFLDHETAKIDALIAEQEKLIELLNEKRQSAISNAVCRGLDPNVPMKDSGVEWLGMVPEHWVVSKTVRYFKVAMGQTILKEDLEDDGVYPVFSATEGSHYFGRINNPTIVLNVGDLVIPARGNSIGFVKRVFEASTTSQTTIYCKNLSSEKVKHDFVFYYMLGFKSNLFYFTQTAIPQITVEEVGGNPILLPPASEQTEIANFLDYETAKIDELKSEAVKASQILQERRSALISAAVTGQIDVRNFQPKVS